MWLQFIWVALVTAFVALLAYYLLRMMSSGVRWRGGTGNQRNLRLIEAISVGAGATVQLVKAGTVYLVIGVSRMGITALGTLTSDEITEIEQAAAPGVPFAKIMERFMPRSGENEAESGLNETSD
jgi:flagellar protein FliO/FliZ